MNGIAPRVAPRRLAVAGLTLGLALTLGACNDDSGGDGGDSGGNGTITLAEWIERADEICAANRDRIGELAAPTFDPADPAATNEQLAEGADFVDDVAEIQQETLDAISQVDQPDEDADAIADALTTRQAAIDDLHAAAATLRDGDQLAFPAALETANAGAEQAAAQEAALGLEMCSQGAATD